MNNTIQLKKVIAGAKAVFALGLLLFALGCNTVLAQGQVTLNAPASVPVNQAFELTLTVANATGNVALPNLSDFDVLGRNQSDQFSASPSGMSRATVFTFTLKPKREGTFKISKAKLTSGNNTIESNEVSIQVTKAVAQPKQQQSQQYNPYDPFANDPFFNPQQQQQSQPEISEADLIKQFSGKVSLKMELSKSSVYEGEMVTATYKLYFTPDVAPQINKLDKVPAFEGFWSQEVELDPHRRATAVTVNGKRMGEFELMKYNLYPQRNGNVKIPTAEIGLVIQASVGGSRSGNPFDMMFNPPQYVEVPLKLKSDGSSLVIKPLPDKDKPADFSGAVGKFNFETSLSSKAGKTDDPLTYTIKISGTGNLKLIEQPTLKLPAEFEVYDPKVKENITNGAAGSTGNKQYDFLIIPRQPGDYKIEARAFSYFDPAAGKYVTINTPEYSVKITGEPSKNPNTGVAATVSKSDVSLIGQDIRYIKTGTPEFKKDNGGFYGSLAFVGLYTTPFLLFIGLIALKRRNDDLAADVIGTKRRRALKLARKRLSVADKYLAANDKKSFYNEVSRATWGYLCDKLNIDLAELSKDNVEEKLQLRTAKPETIQKFKQLIDTCEFALYAPATDEHLEMKKNYDAAMNLIADLEDEIKA